MSCSCRNVETQSGWAQQTMCAPQQVVWGNCECQYPVHCQTEEHECTGTTPGGWSSFMKPNREEIEIFEAAIKHLMGACYAPLYVSTQIVAGTNYLFVAKQVIPGPTCFVDIVTVSIFVALDGTITLGEIKTVRPA